MNLARTSGQLVTLTGLRGIAALAVLFYHIRGGMADYLPAWIITLLGQGYLAVDLFFLLSGFVLWWSFGSAFRDQGGKAILPFLVRRIARIFPLHFAIMLAMVTFVTTMLLIGHGDPEQFPLAELPAHFLLVQNWGFTREFAWNDPAWSISVEWAAYLLLALAGVSVARLPTGRWLFPLAAIIIAAALGLVFAVLGLTSIGNDSPATGLLRCLAEFAIGVLLCQWWQAMGEQPLRNCATAAVIGGVGALLITTGISQPAGIPLVMAAVVILALEASLLKRPPLAGSVAQWLGTISYSLYLSHFFLFILFKIAFVSDADDIHPLGILAFVGAALGLSHLLLLWVELPGRRLFQHAGDAVAAMLQQAWRQARRA